jgi:hypothetical protein
MKLLRVVLLAACTASMSAAAFAHHSFAGTYDGNAKPITVKGEIVQFLFRNPHSFIHIMGPDADGAMQRWTLEWGGGGQIQRMGITRETLRPGDVVIVTGSPARKAEDHRMLVKRIERPLDGWKWEGTFD